MSQVERRRYFRIDDEVALSFTLLDSDDQLSHEEIRSLLLSDKDLEFMGLEMKIRQLMLELRTTDSKLSQVLELLNHKINLLRQIDEFPDAEPVSRVVNLSACGIAFHWNHPLPINQKLHLTLYLYPRHELVKAIAHVAGVETVSGATDNTKASYFLRLDFDQIHPAHQEVLIQHVVQRQGRQIRKQKEQRDAESQLPKPTDEQSEK